MCAHSISEDSLAVSPLGLPDLGDLLLQGQFQFEMVQPSASLILPQLSEVRRFGGLPKRESALQALNKSD